MANIVEAVMAAELEVVTMGMGQLGPHLIVVI